MIQDWPEAKFDSNQGGTTEDLGAKEESRPEEKETKEPKTGSSREATVAPAGTDSEGQSRIFRSLNRARGIFSS